MKFITKIGMNKEYLQAKIDNLNTQEFHLLQAMTKQRNTKL